MQRGNLLPVNHEENVLHYSDNINNVIYNIEQYIIYIYIYHAIKQNTKFTILTIFNASLVAQMVKKLPAIWETWVQSLGQEEYLEKELATHSSILAWRITWTEESGRLQSMGLQRVRYN